MQTTRLLITSCFFFPFSFLLLLYFFFHKVKLLQSFDVSLHLTQRNTAYMANNCKIHSTRAVKKCNRHHWNDPGVCLPLLLGPPQVLLSRATKEEYCLNMSWTKHLRMLGTEPRREINSKFSLSQAKPISCNTSDNSGRTPPPRWTEMKRRNPVVWLEHLSSPVLSTSSLCNYPLCVLGTS